MTDLKNALDKHAAVLSLAAGPLQATRDPAQEAKIRGYVLGGLSTGSFAALFTKTQVDDRLIALAIQAVSDPVRWAQIADALWGATEE